MDFLNDDQSGLNETDTRLLSSWEGASLSGGDSVARAFRILTRRFMELTSIGMKLEGDILQTRLALDAYADDSAWKLMFAAPLGIPNVPLSLPQTLSHGEIIDMSFESQYRPLYPELAPELETVFENRRVYARMWRHPRGEARGRVIAVHGWMMGDQRVNALALGAGSFFRAGLDVVLIELPLHGRRAANLETPPLFPSTQIALTNEAIAQAICDLRTLRQILRQEDELPVGVLGISLGGYLASLWASLDELPFVIAVNPFVSMAEMATALTQDGEGDFSGDILGRETLERAFAGHSPLKYYPKTKCEAICLAAAHDDHFIPPEQVEQLCAHFGKPQLNWFSGGHLSDLSRDEIFGPIHRFLLERGLANETLVDVQIV